MWKATTGEGEFNARYSWFANKRFLKVSAIENPAVSPVMVIGMDPDTGKATIWDFSTTGFSKSILTLEKEGVWVVNTTPNEPNGLRSRTIRVSPDEYQLEFLTLAEDGSERSRGPAWPWKRDKSQ